jgi:hypothetical protein
MTDPLVWGLKDTIQNAAKLNQSVNRVYLNRLWLANCELTDSGATAVGQAIANNRVLTVLLPLVDYL